MKKIIAVLLIAAALAAGRAWGIRYALTRSAVSVSGSSVLIDLDGHVWEHAAE